MNFPDCSHRMRLLLRKLRHVHNPAGHGGYRIMTTMHRCCPRMCTSAIYCDRISHQPGNPLNNSHGEILCCQNISLLNMYLIKSFQRRQLASHITRRMIACLCHCLCKCNSLMIHRQQSVFFHFPANRAAANHAISETVSFFIPKANDHDGALRLYSCFPYGLQYFNTCQHSQTAIEYSAFLYRIEMGAANNRRQVWFSSLQRTYDITTGINRYVKTGFPHPFRQLKSCRLILFRERKPCYTSIFCFSNLPQCLYMIP